MRSALLVDEPGSHGLQQSGLREEGQSRRDALACEARRVSILRQSVRDLMVRIHLVRPELADGWMTEMDDEEIARRLRMYERLKLLTQAESEALRISEGVLS
jgi:hypothetical protein